jgi:hypothetical protein
MHAPQTQRGSSHRNSKSRCLPVQGCRAMATTSTVQPIMAQQTCHWEGAAWCSRPLVPNWLCRFVSQRRGSPPRRLHHRRLGRSCSQLPTRHLLCGHSRRLGCSGSQRRGSPLRGLHPRNLGRVTAARAPPSKPRALSLPAADETSAVRAFSPAWVLWLAAPRSPLRGLHPRNLGRSRFQLPTRHPLCGHSRRLGCSGSPRRGSRLRGLHPRNLGRSRSQLPTRHPLCGHSRRLGCSGSQRRGSPLRGLHPRNLGRSCSQLPTRHPLCGHSRRLGCSGSQCGGLPNGSYQRQAAPLRGHPLLRWAPSFCGCQWCRNHLQRTSQIRPS